MSDHIVWRWGACQDVGRFPGTSHESCYEEFKATTAGDGVKLAAQRCPCECHGWPENGVPA